MRPKIVVFTGGQEEHAALSRESGTWMCQNIPRSAYDVTPVEVTSDGQWKVPVGTLPRGGDVARTMEMLFKATAPQEPKKGLERLLAKNVDSIITLLRGKGGDDGAMHATGDMLGIPVAGSGQHTSQHAFSKHHFAHAISHIAPTPYTQLLPHNEHTEDSARTIWQDFLAPFFIKPVNGSGSHGVVRVQQFEQLQQSIAEAKNSKKDILIQEYRPGLELSVTVYSGTDTVPHSLPPTIITPKAALFYTYYEKQRKAGAHFHGVHESDSPLADQAEAIAEEVYTSLGCSGIATIDMIANDGTIDVLELNTIPSFHVSSPIHHQLQQANMHPEQLLKLAYSL
ncbi:MAG: ATP-grasp domain-containing protein [bacterium]|nr:ATP-grasp domain-containing protein [bacterium]